MAEGQSGALPSRRLAWDGSIALLLAVRHAVFFIWRPDYTNPTTARILTALFLAASVAWLWLIYQLWLMVRGTSGDAFMRWAFIAAVASIVGPELWPWVFGGTGFATAVLMWLSTLATLTVPFLLALGARRAPHGGRPFSIAALVWGVALLVRTAADFLMPFGELVTSHVFNYAATAANVAALVALAVWLLAERRRVEQALQTGAPKVSIESPKD